MIKIGTRVKTEADGKIVEGTYTGVTIKGDNGETYYNVIDMVEIETKMDKIANSINGDNYGEYIQWGTTKAGRCCDIDDMVDVEITEEEEGFKVSVIDIKYDQYGESTEEEREIKIYKTVNGVINYIKRLK